jgi:hypothetical protein
VENDRPPSFQGAVDRWVRGAFFGVFRGSEFSPFRQRVSAHSPAAGNANRLGTLVVGSAFHRVKHLRGCVLMLNSCKDAISPANWIHVLGYKAWWHGQK